MRRVGLVTVVLAAIALVAALTTARTRSGAPLDPRSTDPDGARAAVELLGRFAATTVTATAPGPDAAAAVLLADDFTDHERDRLRAWVRAGGTLLVADPSSPLAPPVTGAVAGPQQVVCGPPALAAVASLDLVGASFDAPDGCRSGAATLVAVTALGAGAVIAIGDARAFTNERLDVADHALVLAAIATGPVAVLDPEPDIGSGDTTLVDLVGTPVRGALAQCVVAALVLVAWRSRRLGPPIRDDTPVRVEGAEWTRATGNLMARQGRAERAAAILRDQARRDLGAALALDATAPPHLAERRVAAAAGVSVDEVHRIVSAPVTTDDELRVVAAGIVGLRQEILRER